MYKAITLHMIELVYLFYSSLRNISLPSPAFFFLCLFKRGICKPLDCILWQSDCSTNCQFTIYPKYPTLKRHSNKELPSLKPSVLIDLNSEVLAGWESTSLPFMVAYWHRFILNHNATRITRPIFYTKIKPSGLFFFLNRKQ